ncbi:hypothetical protein B0H19DRAFT_1259651 [Mycena capillaripes]|nr:hypothetical protein B0H19DRAFT_1259651 [Mycena capillaripes]
MAAFKSQTKDPPRPLLPPDFDSRIERVAASLVFDCAWLQKFRTKDPPRPLLSSDFDSQAERVASAAVIDDRSFGLIPTMNPFSSSRRKSLRQIILLDGALIGRAEHGKCTCKDAFGMFFVNWERVPRVPPALPRCRAWGDLHHQFEEQGVRLRLCPFPSLASLLHPLSSPRLNAPLSPRTPQKHSINQCMLFDENYGLASTQSLKNKDISEGGAEGDYFAFIEGGSADSDLGWNEILLSSDKTVAIIDGSGVLADAAGLDCAELLRLAKLRVPVSHFDKS